MSQSARGPRTFPPAMPSQPASLPRSRRQGPDPPPAPPPLPARARSGDGQGLSVVVAHAAHVGGGVSRVARDGHNTRTMRPHVHKAVRLSLAGHRALTSIDRAIRFRSSRRATPALPPPVSVSTLQQLLTVSLTAARKSITHHRRLRNDLLFAVPSFHSTNPATVSWYTALPGHCHCTSPGSVSIPPASRKHTTCPRQTN